MSREVKLDLTEEEKRLCSQKNPESFETLLKCCKNGYYISKGGYHCYPVLYEEDKNKMKKAFVCIHQAGGIFDNELVDFQNNGAVWSYIFEINNGLLPKELIDYKEDTEITQVHKRGINWLYCQKNQRKIAAGIFASYCSNGQASAIKKLFSFIDLKQKSASVIDVTDCKFLESVDKIDHYGAMLKKDGTPADPKFAGCEVLSGESDDKFPRGYRCYTNKTPYEKVGLLNKSKMTKELIEHGGRFTAFAKRKFTTANGFPIYDLNTVYFRDGILDYKTINHNISEIKRTVSDRNLGDINRVVDEISKDVQENHQNREEIKE